MGDEGARQPGKSPEKEPRIFQTGWASPAPPAAWKPRDCGGGGGGCSGKSHLSPKPSRTSWGTGMNQGAGFCLLQLRNKWLGTSEPLLQVCGLWAAPSPRPRAGPVLSSPQLPLGIPETDSPSQCYPLFSSSLRTALSALSGMLTPCTCHISSGQEEGGCTGDQGRKSLGPTTWSRFSKWPKVGSSPPRPQCPFL